MADPDGTIFEPEFELEWEVGPETEIVFAPDEEEE